MFRPQLFIFRGRINYKGRFQQLFNAKDEDILNNEKREPREKSLCSIYLEYLSFLLVPHSC